MALLDGKVALVTGGGRGLGRQHALALAREGAAVVVNDLGGARDGRGADQGVAEGVVQEIRAAGGRAAAHAGSIATADGGASLVAAAADTFGQADILVHNAGILRDRTLAKLEEADWDAVVAVHLKGAYCTARPLVQHLRARGAPGVVVVTSSTSGLFGNFGQTAYGAAKAGLYGFMRSLALEGARDCIRAWALVPLATTRMSDDLPPMQEPAVRERYDPAQVSEALLYMVSDLSGARSGHVLFAGGGRVAEIRVHLDDGLELGSGYRARDVAAREAELLAPREDFDLFG